MQAIAEAVGRQIIAPGAYIHLAGNRELPRDYLTEDQISFRKDEGGKIGTYVQSAPLFHFAIRDDAGEPVSDESGRLLCDFGSRGHHYSRFVLVLDDVHRFSDGFLDNLVELLANPTVRRAGREFLVPVVVCMTAPPPKLDYIVRGFSGIAARVGRVYQMCFPDFNTLANIIIRPNLLQLKSLYDSEPKARGLSVGKESGYLQYPHVSLDLVRKVSLFALLCCWDGERIRRLSTTLRRALSD
jgi:hypothetical protein